MRASLSVLLCVPLLAVPASVQAKVCWNGKTYLASQPCPKKGTGAKGPTFLPTDKSNLDRYRAELAAFRAQAVEDLATHKLTQAQYDAKLGQYHHAMAELNVQRR